MLCYLHHHLLLSDPWCLALRLKCAGESEVEEKEPERSQLAPCSRASCLCIRHSTIVAHLSHRQHNTMAAPVQVTKSTEVTASTAQTDGMIRKGAIIDKSSISASGMLPRDCVLKSLVHEDIDG